MQILHTLLALTCLAGSTCAHGRIKYPRPINAPPDTPDGNAYNAPLNADGSEFPCKNLHKTISLHDPALNKTKWQAGQPTYFEILGHITPGVEGPLAAHSGGSCQASISFDTGKTFKVLHSYEGGCPRGVALNSNIATDPNQTFNFTIPSDTAAGPALFAWTWVAVSGNRNELYMNCAAIEIEGSGTNKLEGHPDMYVGEMAIPGHISLGQCASTAGTALSYPFPGESGMVTETEVVGIPFKKPTEGRCSAPGSTGSTISETPCPVPSSGTGPGEVLSASVNVSVSSAAAPSSASVAPSPSTPIQLPKISINADSRSGSCKCSCEF